MSSLPLRPSGGNDTPRIYVACLASYNSGILHGRWIDADQEAEDIHAEIAAMLAKSREPIAEEWAIHDYEGFADLPVGEYTDIETIAEWARLLAEHGEAWASYVGLEGADYATEEGFTDKYHGTWPSEADYAEQLIRECHEIPEFLEFYIDWDKLARDLFISDYHSADGEDGVHVFSRC